MELTSSHSSSLTHKTPTCNRSREAITRTGSISGSPPVRVSKSHPSLYEVAYQLTGETGSCLCESFANQTGLSPSLILLPMPHISLDMSPEVTRHEPYNCKADVFGFGIMLYEVFSRSMMSTIVMGEAMDPGL